MGQEILTPCVTPHFTPLGGGGGEFMILVYGLITELFA